MAMNINEMRFRFSAWFDFISHAGVLSEARDLTGIVFVGRLVPNSIENSFRPC